MSLRNLLLMDPGPERDALAKKMGYEFKPTPKIPQIKKFRDEFNNTKRIRGDLANAKKSELEIEKEILTALYRFRIEHWPMKIKGEIHISDGQGFIKPSKNQGFPDILCCFNGKFIGIEVKKPGGIQSAVQISMENRITKAGGIYLIVTSVAELEIKLRLRGVL